MMYQQIDSNKRKTIFLIGFFLIFLIGFGWILSYAFNLYWIFPLAIGIALFQAVTGYYYSDKITLAISGARPIARNENVDLHRIVENLAITAGLPKPKIYMIDDPAPNAFATGRDPEHAAICVTSGLLEIMNKNELQGVLAHEMSHIGNYDIRLMTIVVVLVGIVALISDWTLRWMFWGGGRRRSGNGEGGQLQLVLLIVGIALAIIAPIAAMLIQLAVSRKREYLADATGSLMTRYPQGLASALEKISSSQYKLHSATRATAHLFIVNPLKQTKTEKESSWFVTLFMTHPPIQERIKALDAMIPGGK